MNSEDSRISAKQISSVLGLGESLSNYRDLERLVEVGMPKSALGELLHRLTVHSGQSISDLRCLVVPPATYKRLVKFNLQESESIEQIARLYLFATEAFSSDASAPKFMLSKHLELEGRTPFEVSLTEIGGRLVDEIIERSLHGLPA